MENLGRFYSSPGMVSESFTLFKATNLTKTGPVGGTPDENIAVHRVPPENISDYIDARRGEVLELDVKLLLILACFFLRSSGWSISIDVTIAYPPFLLSWIILFSSDNFNY